MTTRREFFGLSGMALAASTIPTGAADAASSKGEGTQITQIRNATLRIDYAGVRFLVDPMLSERHSWPGFPGTANSEQRNPLVHLPLPIEDLIDVDAVIVTHLHEDHWDHAAQTAIAKGLPVFAQNEADATTIRAQGFTDVRLLSETSEFNGVRLTKTNGRHGTETLYKVIGERLGEVSGVVFAHTGEKTIYVAGDTIWNEDVASALAAHKPDIVVLNTGHAKVVGLDDALLMGTGDVVAVHKAAPEAILVASHMEALNHCTLTRAELRSFAVSENFSDKLLTPADGEALVF